MAPGTRIRKESPGRAGASKLGRYLRIKDALMLSQSTNRARHGSRYASESCKVRVQKITVAFNHWVSQRGALLDGGAIVLKEIEAEAALEDCRALISQINDELFAEVCGRALRECLTGSRASVVSWVRRFGS